MICKSGQIALVLYLATIVSFSSIFLPDVFLNYVGCTLNLFLAIIIYFVVVNLLLRIIYKIGNVFSNENYQVGIRAALLGFIFALGLFVKVHGIERCQIFGLYMCIISFFHFSEYISMAIIQPSLVSTDSFVINHSKEYAIAAMMSWFEFFVESYFFPGMKTYSWISNIGVLMCICGEFLRKCAMLTAKSNFNHLIQYEKQPDHVLVTHGIYSIVRHPSYVGWFYWSIGTQITLLNPLCTLAYTFVSWSFFKERIIVEEMTLLAFFGSDYNVYKKKVSTGIPFIDGY